jgi:carbonic anhydrase
MQCNTLKELLEKIEENNQMFSKEQVELLQKITNSQHPKITLLTCSDSRLDISYFKLEAIDKVFVVRNI